MFVCCLYPLRIQAHDLMIHQIVFCGSDKAVDQYLFQEGFCVGFWEARNSTALWAATLPSPADFTY